MTTPDRLQWPTELSPMARDAWLGVLEEMGYTVFDDNDPSPAPVINGMAVPRGFAWSLDGGDGGKEGRDFSRTFPTEDAAILDAVRAILDGGDPEQVRTVNATQVRLEQNVLHEAMVAELSVGEASIPGVRPRL